MNSVDEEKAETIEEKMKSCQIIPMSFEYKILLNNNFPSQRSGRRINS